MRLGSRGEGGSHALGSGGGEIRVAGDEGTVGS